MKTYQPSAADLQQSWWLLDAEGKNIGRLASRIATVLQGKHRPDYTPSAAPSDHVVVVNAQKIEYSGDRGDQKRYIRHSGFPGGIRDLTLNEMLERHPERVIRIAVRGMLPRGRRGRKMIKKLKIYKDGEHPHDAQQPSPIDKERLG